MQYSASDVGETKSSSHIVSGAIRMNLVIGLRSALFGRLVVGALVLSMLMTIAPPLTLPATLAVALSTLGTPTLAVTVWQPQPNYFVTSWKLGMQRQSGITLILVTKGQTSSCMVATL